MSTCHVPEPRLPLSRPEALALARLRVSVSSTSPLLVTPPDTVAEAA